MMMVLDDSHYIHLSQGLDLHFWPTYSFLVSRTPAIDLTLDGPVIPSPTSRGRNQKKSTMLGEMGTQHTCNRVT